MTGSNPTPRAPNSDLDVCALEFILRSSPSPDPDKALLLFPSIPCSCSFANEEDGFKFLDFKTPIGLDCCPFPLPFPSNSAALSLPGMAAT